MASPIDTLTATLAPEFGERWITSAARRDQYVPREGHEGQMLPDAVVRPLNIAEVQRVMRAASDARVPVVPWGVGSSLEGNAGAVTGGITVDLSGMDRIIEVAAPDLLCVVEPGVTREALNTELRATGLFFPIDPGANASLGGMVSTRASGTNAVRYGTMKDNVLALKMVLPDGSLIRTGTRARKSSAGYDLTRLFTGSEGTLGLVVEATLRLYGIPETVTSGIWPFPTLEAAVDTVIATIQMGIPVARIELLDPPAVSAVNAYAGLDMPVGPMLFVELHGSPASVAEQREQITAIGAEFGAGAPELSSDPDEQRRLWRARHQAMYAFKALRPGCATWSTDVCVPISQLAATITMTQRMIEEAGLIAPIVGHVGDGNFHVLFVLPPERDETWDRAREVNEAMVAFALSVGGTCTGEHGVGLGKRKSLIVEHGEESVATMKRIKAAIDPLGLMNPGKIFA